METPRFQEHSKSNPQLHLLHVKWGLAHLVTIDDCLKKLNSFSNCNLLGCTLALTRERQTLLDTNKAYQDADEILQSITRR